MLELQFNPFPILSTERLILRQLNFDDAEEVFYLRSDPSIMRYIPRPKAKSKIDASQVIQTMAQGISNSTSINWGITLKEQTKILGIIGFVRLSKEDHRAEVGYMLNPAYHQRAIMHEALEKVLDYGFNQAGFHTIEAVIDPDNLASEKLLLKNGFVKEAHFRENVYFEGQYLDSVHYTLFTPA